MAETTQQLESQPDNASVFLRQQFPDEDSTIDSNEIVVIDSLQSQDVANETHLLSASNFSQQRSFPHRGIWGDVLVVASDIPRQLSPCKQHPTSNYVYNTADDSLFLRPIQVKAILSPTSKARHNRSSHRRQKQSSKRNGNYHRKRRAPREIRKRQSARARNIKSAYLPQGYPQPIQNPIGGVKSRNMYPTSNNDNVETGEVQNLESLNTKELNYVHCSLDVEKRRLVEQVTKLEGIRVEDSATTVGQSSVNSVDIDDKSMASVLGMSESEFAALEQRMASQHDELSTAELEKFKSAFKEFDADNSGDISPDELRLVMNKLEPNLDSSEIDNLITQADTDGDGTINYEEFITMFKARKKLISMASSLTKAMTHSKIQQPFSTQESSRRPLPPLKLPLENVSREQAKKRKRPGYTHTLATNPDSTRTYSQVHNAKVVNKQSTALVSLAPLYERMKDKEPKARDTPHCLRGSSNAKVAHGLREQLAFTEYQLQCIDQRVQENIDWVQQHCPVTSLKAQLYCKRWGAQKLSNLFKRIEHSFILGAWKKWTMLTLYLKNQEQVQKYMKYKAGRQLGSMFGNWKRKKTIVAWNTWIRIYENQIRLEKQSAVGQIQRVARGKLGRNRAVQVFRSGAATVIQRNIRGLLGRNRVRAIRHGNYRHSCATRIQCTARVFLAKKTISKLRESKLSWDSAIVIQQAWRTYQSKTAAGAVVLDLRQGKSAIELQRIWRGFATRKKVAMLQLKRKQPGAATKIQALYRGFVGRRLGTHIMNTRLQVVAEDEAALCIQCFVRSCLALRSSAEERAWRARRLITTEAIESRTSKVVPKVFPSTSDDTRTDTAVETLHKLEMYETAGAQREQPDEPDQVVANELKESAADEPDQSVANELQESAADEPDQVTASELQESAADGPDQSIERELKESAADEPDQVTARELKESAADEPDQSIERELKESAADEPDQVTASELKESAADEPDQVVANELKESDQVTAKGLNQNATDELEKQDVAVSHSQLLSDKPEQSTVGSRSESEQIIRIGEQESPTKAIDQQSNNESVTEGALVDNKSPSTWNSNEISNTEADASQFTENKKGAILKHDDSNLDQQQASMATTDTTVVVPMVYPTGNATVLTDKFAFPMGAANIASNTAESNEGIGHTVIAVSELPSVNKVVSEGNESRNSAQEASNTVDTREPSSSAEEQYLRTNSTKLTETVDHDSIAQHTNQSDEKENPAANAKMSEVEPTTKLGTYTKKHEGLELSPSNATIEVAKEIQNSPHDATLDSNTPVDVEGSDEEVTAVMEEAPTVTNSSKDNCKSDAAVHIQSLTRGMLTRAEIAAKHTAASQIQKSVRGMIVRVAGAMGNENATKEKAAITIQRIVRGRLAKRKIDFHKQEAQIALERLRRVKEQDQANREAEAAIRIQASIRARRAHQIAREKREQVDRLRELETEQQQVEAATKLQALMRRNAARNRVRELKRERDETIQLEQKIRWEEQIQQSSALTIQLFFRQLVARARMQRRRVSVEAQLKAQQEETERKQRHSAAVRIQSLYRCRKEYRQFQLQKEARYKAEQERLKEIETRMELERKEQFEREQSTIKAQAHIRRHLAKKQFEVKLEKHREEEARAKAAAIEREKEIALEASAVRIQASVRSRLVRKQMVVHREEFEKRMKLIQEEKKAEQERREFELNLLRQTSALRIQGIFRTRKAKLRVSNLREQHRQKLALELRERQRRAKYFVAVKLQARFRGREDRKRVKALIERRAKQEAAAEKRRQKEREKKAAEAIANVENSMSMMGGMNNMDMMGGMNNMDMMGGMNNMGAMGGMNSMAMMGGMNNMAMMGGMNNMGMMGGMNNMGMMGGMNNMGMMGGGMNNMGMTGGMNNMGMMGGMNNMGMMGGMNMAAMGGGMNNMGMMNSQYQQPIASNEYQYNPATAAASEWVEYFDDTSQSYYYFNTITQETRWDDPRVQPAGVAYSDSAQTTSGYDTGVAATGYDEQAGGYYDYNGEWVDTSGGQTEVSTTSGDWSQYFDETSGAAYYYNNVTGETSWTLPQ